MDFTLLFPKIVGIVNGIEVSKDVIDLLMGEELEANVANHISKSRYLLEMPEMAELKSVLMECMNRYIEHAIKPIDETTFKITQSWLNVARKGEQHHYHSHGNSVVSGCLYLSADKAVDSIKFFRENQPEIQIQSKEFDVFNSETWILPVSAGDLIFFSSRMPHAVPPNVRDEKRVSLAFNAFPEGFLGAPATSNELQIQVLGGSNVSK